MKLGILTFHRAINYGAVLQAFALQTALKKVGIESEILDYRCPKIERTYEEYRRKNLFRHAKPLLNLQYDRKNQKFARFAHEYLRISGEYDPDRRSLSAAAGKYDAFLTGSDQVWNPICTDSDPAYLLDFVPAGRKKYSYAASFGLSDVPKDWESQCRVLLKDYRGLSVRERQGQKILRGTLGKTAAVHLDPVFLLRPEEWNEIAAVPKQKGYILVYLMQESGELLGFAGKLSAETGRRVVILQSGLRRPVRADYVRCAGPQDFLGYVVNAAYVITNSFHGTAFSILYHKDFYTGLLRKPAGVNSRLENILGFFGLNSRKICCGADADFREPILYDPVETVMRAARKEAFDYLSAIKEQGLR